MVKFEYRIAERDGYFYPHVREKWLCFWLEWERIYLYRGGVETTDALYRCDSSKEDCLVLIDLHKEKDKPINVVFHEIH